MSYPQRQYITLNILMDRIRSRIVQKGIIGVKKVSNLLLSIEKKSTDLIDIKTDLPKLINDLGIIVNKTELIELGRLLDQNKTGKISFIDFALQIAPPMNEIRTMWIKKAFDKIDLKNEGRVKNEILSNLFNPDPNETIKIGKISAKDIFKNLIETYDNDFDGFISREDFNDIYREISPSIKDDEEFINLIKNTWKI